MFIPIIRTLDPRFFAWTRPVSIRCRILQSHGPSIIGAIKPEVGAVGDDLYLAAERSIQTERSTVPTVTPCRGHQLFDATHRGWRSLCETETSNYTTAQLKSRS